MPDIENPFTQEDFDQIEAGLERAAKIEAAIKKAQRAGIELPGQLDELRQSRKRLQALKSTYWPGR